MSVIGSIKTNVAANTALLNLENTVTSLQNTQAEISTGLAVSTAKDNASYFSIATVLRSDSSALSSVSDTLNLGDSSLTVSSTALSQIQTTLSDIKNQLVDAALPNADMTTIQQKISADQQQLQNVAQSANFNGQNFLSVELWRGKLQFDDEFHVVLYPQLGRGDFGRFHQYRHCEHSALRSGPREPLGAGGDYNIADRVDEVNGHH